jgi:hypothetical protein
MNTSDSDQLTRDDVLKLPWELRIRRREDALVLMLRDRLVELSDSAGFILRALDGRSTLGQVAARLAQEYDLDPEEAQEDVIALVTALLPYEMVVRAS